MTDGLRSARESFGKKMPTPAARAAPKETAAEKMKQQLRSFAPWINRFGCCLFRRLAATAESGDIAVASAPLVTLIGALSLTSADEDVEETCDALFGRTPSDVDKLGKQMSKLLVGQIRYKFKVVTGLFVPPTCRLDRAFAEKLTEKFCVSVRKLPKEQRHADEINQFVRQESSNQLTSMLDPEDDVDQKFSNSMIVAVGVYVHPLWQSRFERNLTTHEDFYESAEKSYSVATMHRLSQLAYVRSDLCPGVMVDVVGVPCRGQGATIYFVLPTKRFGLDDVISRFTGDRGATLISYCQPRLVRMSLPKLRVSSNSALRSALRKMGVKAWLDIQHPALEGIVKGRDLSIGQIHHKVTIKLNEDGDVAAEEKANEEEAVDFRCDQPFMILFHHAESNAFWMVGMVKQPKG